MKPRHNCLGGVSAAVWPKHFVELRVKRYFQNLTGFPSTLLTCPEGIQKEEKLSNSSAHVERIK